MRKKIINSILVATLSASSLFAIAADPDQVSATDIVTTIEQAQVNINTADVNTLARELNGIGIAKARAIIEYREAHGAFTTVDEILEVKGIGLAILEKNATKIKVK